MLGKMLSRKKRKPKGPPPRELPRVLSPAEARALLAVTADKPKHQAMIAIGLYAGLRCAEILNLTVGDIDTEQSLIQVRQGKGGRDARLPLNIKLRRYLLPFLDGREPQAPLITGPDDVSPYSTRALRHIVTEAAQKAGLPGHVHVHTLRHTFGTEVQRLGGDVARTQKLMRHSNIQTSMIYVHLVVDDVRPLADGLDFDP